MTLWLNYENIVEHIVTEVWLQFVQMVAFSEHVTYLILQVIALNGELDQAP